MAKLTLEADLHFVVEHHLRDLLAAAGADRDLNVGLSDGIALQEVWQDVRADRRCSTDHEAATRACAERVHRLGCVAGGPQGSLSMRLQSQTGIGEAHASAQALEQADAELSLHLGDTRGDRRLGQIEPLSRAGKGARRGNLDKRFQSGQIDAVDALHGGASLSRANTSFANGHVAVDTQLTGEAHRIVERATTALIDQRFLFGTPHLGDMVIAVDQRDETTRAAALHVALIGPPKAGVAGGLHQAFAVGNLQRQSGRLDPDGVAQPEHALSLPNPIV